MADIKDQLVVINERVEDTELVSIVLNSLHYPYQIFMTSLTLARKANSLSFDE
jgi:hypothetical protein